MLRWRTLVVAVSVLAGASGAGALYVQSRPALAPLVTPPLDESVGKLEKWDIGEIVPGQEAVPLVAGEPTNVRGILRTKFLHWSQSLQLRKEYRETRSQKSKRSKANPPELQVWLIFVRQGTISSGEKIASRNLFRVRLDASGECHFSGKIYVPKQPGEYQMRLTIGEYNFFDYKSMQSAPQHVIAVAKANVMADKATP